MTDADRPGDAGTDADRTAAADRPESDPSDPSDPSDQSDPAMTDDNDRDDASADGDASSSTSDARFATLSADSLRGILDRLALVALALLALIAGWSFYSHTGTAIRTWIDPAFQPIALAAFNLAVLFIALAGVAHQLRRLRSDEVAGGSERSGSDESGGTETGGDDADAGLFE